MTIRRRSGAAALTGAIALLGLALPHGFLAARADGVNQECTNNDDITVVIDFQNVDGTDNGVNVRCAPQPVDSGRAALVRGKVNFEDYRGFVCRISGLPKAGPCNTYPPANAYWVYWLAQRGGAWCYSQVGFDTRTPPPGTLEGWSFALKKSSSKLPPPRYPVPAAIAGTTPNSLNGGDCSADSGPPAPPTTSAPSATTEVTSAPNGSAEPPVASPPTTRRDATTTTPAVTTSGEAATSSSSTTPSDLIALASTTSSSVPYGSLDLSVAKGTGRSSSSPLGLLVAGGVVVVIGGLAAWRVLARRRA